MRRYGRLHVTRAAIAFEHDVVAHAAEQMPEVVAPLRDAAGATIVTPPGGGSAAVFPYIEGTTGRRDLATACAAARVLARFHRAMHDVHVASGMRSARFLGMLPWLRERFTRFAADPLVARKLDWDALVAATTAATARVAPRAAALPHVVVHGDPNPGNVVSVQPGEVRGLIDFDFAHETERVYDVGTLLDEFARDGDDAPLDLARDRRRCSPRTRRRRRCRRTSASSCPKRCCAAPRRWCGTSRRATASACRATSAARRATPRAPPRSSRTRTRSARPRVAKLVAAALWALLALAVVVVVVMTWHPWVAPVDGRFAPSSRSIAAPPRTRPGMTRIVVLGGGFAGVAVARRLEKKLRRDEAEIALVSRDNFTLFTPMLPEVSSGGLEPRHVATPVRAQLHRTKFVLGEIARVDLDAHAVEARHPITGAVTRLEYDHIVLALGSVTSTFGIPGVAEHTLPLKTLEDAETLRNRVIASLEQAVVTPPGPERDRLLTFAVVGGGYTGCECAGELVDFFHSIVPFYRPLRMRRRAHDPHRSGARAAARPAGRRWAATRRATSRAAASS